jgi:hypothetical protein
MARRRIVASAIGESIAETKDHIAVKKCGFTLISKRSLFEVSLDALNVQTWTAGWHARAYILRRWRLTFRQQCGKILYDVKRISDTGSVKKRPDRTE